jgi:hypothetical protein
MFTSESAPVHGTRSSKRLSDPAGPLSVRIVPTTAANKKGRLEGRPFFLIGFFAYMFIQSADSRRTARELAVAAAREKQQAEEIREAERARQEAIADAEWNARFV